MSHVADKPAEPKNRVSEQLGWREIAALAAALVVSISVLVFQDELSRLEALGYIGAFLFMVLTNAILILPSSGLIMIFLLAGSVGNPLILGIVAGLGATVGETTGYLAGYSGHKAIARTSVYRRIHHQVERHAVGTIFVLAFIPNPLFDMAGIAAGALRLHWAKFFLPTLAGKVLKMTLIAYAGAYSVTWVQSLL